MKIPPFYTRNILTFLPLSTVFLEDIFWHTRANVDENFVDKVLYEGGSAVRRLTAAQAEARRAKMAYSYGTLRFLSIILLWIGVTYGVHHWLNTWLGLVVWLTFIFAGTTRVMGGTDFQHNHIEWIVNFFVNNVVGSDFVEVFWLGPQGYGRQLIRRGKRYRAGYTVIELPLGGWFARPRIFTANPAKDRWRILIPPDVFSPNLSLTPEMRLPEVILVDCARPAIRHRLAIDRVLDLLEGEHLSDRESGS